MKAINFSEGCGGSGGGAWAHKIFNHNLMQVVTSDTWQGDGLLLPVVGVVDVLFWFFVLPSWSQTTIHKLCCNMPAFFILLCLHGKLGHF